MNINKDKSGANAPLVQHQRAITIHPPLRAELESDDDPYRLAKCVIANRYCVSGHGPSLHYWRGEWWWWDSRCYNKISTDELRAEMTHEVKREFNLLAGGLKTPK